jgi:hypothetical protein
MKDLVGARRGKNMREGAREKEMNLVVLSIPHNSAMLANKN